MPSPAQSINRRILGAAWSTTSFKIGFFVFLALLVLSLVSSVPTLIEEIQLVG
jgi:peptide/nickel transport system permease protein